MPHQNTDSIKATNQNAATDPHAPNDAARDEHASTHAEPRAYAASNVADSTLAAPAAGEVGDYADLDAEDDALGGGAQQGRTHNDRERHAQHEIPDGHGPKTTEANREMSRSGSPDQGTH